MQVKAVIGLFVVVALVAVMVARGDEEQGGSGDEASGFEAWEGDGDLQPAQEADNTSGEAATGDAAEGRAKTDGPRGAIARTASEGGNAEGRGAAAPHKATGAGELAGGGDIPNFQGGAAAQRDDQAPQRKAGTISEEVLRESIESVRPIARQCYLDALEDFPDVDGRVMLEFEIISEDGQGRVAMTEVGEDSTLYESSLHECLQHHISEVVFDSPGEDAALKVTYPFNFAQEAGLCGGSACG